MDSDQELIEVTPAMIDAGYCVIEFQGESLPMYALAEAVYRAMELERRSQGSLAKE